MFGLSCSLKKSWYFGSKAIYFVKLFSKSPAPLSISKEIIEIACDYLKQYPGIKARDAVHAATVKHYKLSGIVSYDKHFDQICDIKRTEP